MRHEILLSPEAIQDYKELDPWVRAGVRRTMEVHLRYEPGRTSRSRIKRLRGVARPQYRLRVGDVRVFYDIEGETVNVLGIVLKSDADRWLDEIGNTP